MKFSPFSHGAAEPIDKNRPQFIKGGRLPFQVDVTCNHGTVDDFIPSFNFVVILNQYVFGFSEVSGLDKELYYENLDEGGNPSYVFARKYSTNVDTITLRRGMLIRGGRLASNAIRTALSQATMIGNNFARKAALVAAAALDPIATLEDGPAYGFIQLFDRRYEKAKATFSFFSHGASNWSLSSLSATSGDFMYEEIRLCCSDLRRMSDSIVPSGFWNASGKDDHTFYDLDRFEGLNKESIETIEEQKKENLKKFNKEVKEKKNEREKYAEEMDKIEEQKEKNRKDFFVESEKEVDNRAPEDIAKEAMENRKNRIAEFEKQKKEIKEKQNERDKKEAKQQEDINKIEEQKEKNKKEFFVEPKKEVDNRAPEDIAKEAMEERKNRVEESEKQNERDQKEAKQQEDINKIEEQKKQNREKFEQNRDKK